jgi:hypothetical protein
MAPLLLKGDVFVNFLYRFWGAGIGPAVGAVGNSQEEIGVGVLTVSDGENFDPRHRFARRQTFQHLGLGVAAVGVLPIGEQDNAVKPLFAGRFIFGLHRCNRLRTRADGIVEGGVAFHKKHIEPLA